MRVGFVHVRHRAISQPALASSTPRILAHGRDDPELQTAVRAARSISAQYVAMFHASIRYRYHPLAPAFQQHDSSALRGALAVKIRSTGSARSVKAMPCSIMRFIDSAQIVVRSAPRPGPAAVRSFGVVYVCGYHVENFPGTFWLINTPVGGWPFNALCGGQFEALDMSAITASAR